MLPFPFRNSFPTRLTMRRGFRTLLCKIPNIGQPGVVVVLATAAPDDDADRPATGIKFLLLPNGTVNANVVVLLLVDAYTKHANAT